MRRECEERFELTEALSEARLQLLASHRGTKIHQPPRTTSNEAIPSPPSSSTERGRREFQRKLKLNNSHAPNSNTFSNSTQCFANNETGISFDKVKASLDENYNRNRISQAVARQRVISRTTSFDKMS